MEETTEESIEQPIIENLGNETVEEPIKETNEKKIEESVESIKPAPSSPNSTMLQALIQERENEYKAYVEDITESTEQDSISEVHVVEEEDELITEEVIENNESQNSNNDQPLKADIIDLNNESEVTCTSEDVNSEEVSIANDQPLKAEIIDLSEETEQVKTQEEEEVKVVNSDNENCDEELNGFKNALKSIDEINNAEKQFLIPDSQTMEEMIHKSLKRHSKNNSLNLSSPPFTPNSARNSLEVSFISENRNSYQSSQSRHSGSNLHLQISPPQPPPDAPLPPTPHGVLPPRSILNDVSKDMDKRNSDSSMDRKGHMQHYSLGRLTEFTNEEAEEIVRSRSNRTSRTSSVRNSSVRNSSLSNRNSSLSNHSSAANRNSINRNSTSTIATDNSIILNSNVQTVTVQEFDPTNPPINKKKASRNSQPLQAVVYKIDSEDESTEGKEEVSEVKKQLLKKKMVLLLKKKIILQLLKKKIMLLFKKKIILMYKKKTKLLLKKKKNKSKNKNKNKSKNKIKNKIKKRKNCQRKMKNQQKNLRKKARNKKK